MSYMKLAKISIQQTLNDYGDRASENYLGFDDEPRLLSKEIHIYDHPLIGVSSACDDLYETHKARPFVGSDYSKPTEWLKGAKSVITLMYPFSQDLMSCHIGRESAGDLWASARTQGQAYVYEAAQYLEKYLKSKGYQALVVVTDDCIWVAGEENVTGNWSDPYGTYVSGLMNLSKNEAMMITKKAYSPTFSTIITDMALDPDEGPKRN